MADIRELVPTFLKSLSHNALCHNRKRETLDACIEICLAYKRNNVTTSSSFLQLYIFLVHIQQKLSINNNNNNEIQMAKLHTPDRSSGENTRSRLVEHASSTFRWFLHFVPKNNEFFQVLGSSTI